ncbi:MAG: septum formation initiator family protein [Spirochaetaceae bacterium]|nr:septum formation initiator family protein [Spirochaetaceae bacterium]
MTTKYAHLFLITSLITYIFLFTFVSPNGLKQYNELKVKIDTQNNEIKKLESDVISLENYKNDLKNGNFVLDNALELGYVNEGDKVTFFKDKNISKNTVNSKYILQTQTQDTKVIKKNKMNTFIFVLSPILGLVITFIFSVISRNIYRNNTKKEAKNERRDI